MAGRAAVAVLAETSEHASDFRVFNRAKKM